MTDDLEALRPALAQAASQLELSLSVAETNTLIAYLALLQRWNATYNLTAVRDPAQMLTQHIADCLALMTPLRRQVGTRITRLLDVGSGGGLPGILIATMNPAIDVTCVDTVGKKAAFIRQAAGELRLKNLHAEHARVEQLRCAPFDVITSRAFSSLADFVKLTIHLRVDDGVWMAMKGKHPADELTQLPANIEVFHVEQLTVPGLAAERCLVWMRPHSPI